MWIDSHCHLDAPEFNADLQQVIFRAKAVGVNQIVIPAVAPAHYDRVYHLAQTYHLAYALGIHPLWMEDRQMFNVEQDKHDLHMIGQLHAALIEHRYDQHLVALGEIGLDYFVKNLDSKRQWFFYIEQLKLAKEFNLPVILHVRQSADMLLKGLRQIGGLTGIAHAFNGSDQQAQQFINLGFKLGFGGACTFVRATQIRHLAKSLPLSSMVLETDAPDMPPYWLYKTAQERAQGIPQGRNEPAQLPAIAQEIAQLRKITLQEVSAAVIHNTLQVLPGLKKLCSVV